MVDPKQVLPRTAPPAEVLRAAIAAVDRGERVVVATVVARHGSAPSTPGQKLALFAGGAAIGTIGGGAVERAVLERMAAALGDAASEPRIETFRLGPSLGMCCGGSADILVEPMSAPALALVIGAGHVGVYLAPLLASLGFRVTLCDAREAAMAPARLAAALGPLGALGSSFGGSADGGAGSGAAPPVRLVRAEHDDPEVLAGFGADLRTAAALVMTHDHQLDQAAIEWALGRGFGFVGGVGSRAKAARTRARLEAKGVAPADVARVRMPLGVAIGARSPAEIGVAIAAELVAWRAERRSAARPAAKSAPEPAADDAIDAIHAIDPVDPIDAGDPLARDLAQDEATRAPS